MCERGKNLSTRIISLTLRIETWGEKSDFLCVFINKIAKKSGFCYPFRYSFRPKRRGERKREARLKRERKLKTSGARTRGGPPRRSRDRLCAQRCGSRWRRALLAGDISGQQASTAGRRVHRRRSAARSPVAATRETLLFFPPFSLLSPWCARVCLSLSLSSSSPPLPLSLFCPSVAICHPRVSAACVVARVSFSRVRACDSRLVLGAALPGASVSRVCSERGGDYHAVAKW